MPEAVEPLQEAKDLIAAAVVQNSERNVALLRELIHASRNGEAEIQAIVAERLEKIGAAVDTFKYKPRELSTRHEFADPSVVDPDEHTCVVARIRGRGSGRSLMLFAQGDTMPVKSIDAWTRPPFDGLVEDGRLYGWGVADDLVGVAAMVGVVEAASQLNVRFDGDIIIASTPSKRRARGVIAVMERGYLPDAVVYVHPAESFAGLGEIKQACAGLLSFRVTVPGKAPPTGEPGHTAFHHLAVDPLDKALAVIAALGDLNADRGSRVHHQALHDAVGRSTNLHVAHVRCGDESMLIRVPHECVLAGSISVPPGEALEGVQAEVTAAISRVAQDDAWLSEHPPILDWIVGVPGAETSTSHPLYQVAQAAIERLTGRTPHMNPMHTASDIRNPMIFADIPTIGLGPLAGNLSQVGGTDEWVDLEEFTKTSQVLGHIMVDWCIHDTSSP